MFHKTIKTTMLLSSIAFTTISLSAFSAIPTNYYDTIDMSNQQGLANSLHNIIKDHTKFPYTSSATDTWDVLELADQDPNNSNNVIDIYKNASYTKAGGGNTFYNREHSWPKSYGFPKDGSTNYPYTDMHHLFIADSGYNSSRSNKPYADCNSCSEKVTLVNDGRGGTVNDSNWTTGSFSTGSWETWQGRKGDVARALMYMAVRYDGGNHGITGAMEPDLILTDDRDLIASSNVGSNITVAYMGLKSTLIQWSKDDPVDSYELLHNETVFSFQGNRNPFVDHPEYITCVFENICSAGGDVTPPTTPNNFSAVGGEQLVTLDWSANIEADLAGYNIYRSSTSGNNFVKLNSTVLNTNTYTDNNVDVATTYFYKVAAIDITNNESALSVEIFATTDGSPQPPTGNNAWLNEIHYDNNSTDIDEMIEVAGSEGLDLTGWQLVAYNGNAGGVYKTIALSGSLPNQGNGFGTLSFAFAGLQNGAPDGVALVDASGEVVEFISYEGSFTATDGVASGMTSVDIGVSETSSTPLGYSLQRAGDGQQASDFTWQTAAMNTAGLVNNGQTFGEEIPVNQLPNAVIIDICNDLICSFDASGSTDSDGSIVSYDWNFGDSNTSSLTSTSHTYSADGSYLVQLRVTDNAGGIATSSVIVDVMHIVSEPWINEIHYDNKGSDKSEGVEIAARAGTDLTNWRIEAYNGIDGLLYKTINLSGVVTNQQNGFGTINFAAKGLQNGTSDGLALIDNNGVVVQFLSYEGTLTATDGAAIGLVSIDIVVSETSTTNSKYSLQLGGNGLQYSDFVWQNASSNTRGAINNNQSF